MTMLNAALAGYRTRSGLSCGQIAVKLGVSSRCVQYWMHGSRVPSERSQDALCGLLGITPKRFHELRGAAA